MAAISSARVDAACWKISAATISARSLACMYFVKIVAFVSDIRMLPTGLALLLTS